MYKDADAVVVVIVIVAKSNCIIRNRETEKRSLSAIYTHIIDILYYKQHKAPDISGYTHTTHGPNVWHKKWDEVRGKCSNSSQQQQATK